MRKLPNKARTLALTAFCIVAVAGCGGESHDDTVIDQFLCTGEDTGPDFIELTRGEFTPDDLAALAPETEEARQQYASGGMVRGRFVFLKQVLSNPPFDPPLNLLCQAVEFESSKQAAAYELGLGDSAPQWAGLVWLPEATRDVEQVAPSLQRITFQEAGQDVTVLVQYAVSGRFFYSVYLGRNGEPPAQSELAEIVRGVAARAGAEN